MNRGTFNSIYEVNQAYPTGGVRGDYVIIGGTAYYWWPAAGKWTAEGSTTLVEDSEEGLELLLSKLDEYIGLVNDALDRAAEITTGGIGLGGLLTSLNHESTPSSQGYLHWDGNHYTWENNLPGLGNGILALNNLTAPSGGGFLYNAGTGNGWAWQWVHAGQSLRISGTTLSLVDERNSVLNSVTLPSGNNSLTLTGLLNSFQGESAPNQTQVGRCLCVATGSGYEWKRFVADISVSGSQLIFYDGRDNQIGTQSLNFLPLSGGSMANTTLVTNLNADQLDGHEGSYYAQASDLTTLAGRVTNVENLFDSSGAANVAKTLKTTRQIWGRDFDGSANVTGPMSGVTNISMGGSITGVSSIDMSGHITGVQSITLSKRLNIAEDHGIWCMDGSSSWQAFGLYNQYFQIGNGTGSFQRQAHLYGYKMLFMTGTGNNTNACRLRIEEDGHSIFYNNVSFYEDVAFSEDVTFADSVSFMLSPTFGLGLKLTNQVVETNGAASATLKFSGGKLLLVYNGSTKEIAMVT